MSRFHIPQVLTHSVLYVFFACAILFLPLQVSLPAPTTQTTSIGYSVTLSAAHAQTGPSASTKTKDLPTSCGGWGWLQVGVVTCATRWTISVLATLVIQAGVLILGLASGLFGLLIDRTIIGFGAADGILTKGVQDGITIAWTALRNISNILIIGFFTFIAINIILGSAEFGQKKLVARVLIVAILINFSLFFTKVIIDFSNYTATQFYRQATILQTRPNTGGTPEGIGDQFMNALGVTSFAQTQGEISKLGETQNGIASMLLISIMSFVILLATAMVLFYGSFILASRAILLVFLMITAALAFTTWLIPTFASKGWDTWRKALIESAVLAPMLMLFLWATLAIARALKAANNGGTLGGVLVNPANAGDLGALFSYLVILGLLFATFKVTYSFSRDISGFNWASVAPAIGVAGFARAGAFAGKNMSAIASRGLNAAANRITSNSKMATLGKGALYGASARAATLSLRSQNLMNTGVGALVASQVKKTGLTQPVLAGANRPPIFNAAQQSATNSILQAIAAKKPPAPPSITPPPVQKALPKPPTTPPTPTKPPTAPVGAALPKPPTAPSTGAVQPTQAKPAAAGPQALPKPAAASAPGTTPPTGVQRGGATDAVGSQIAEALKEGEKNKAESNKAAAAASDQKQKQLTEEIGRAVAGATAESARETAEAVRAAGTETQAAVGKIAEQASTSQKEVGQKLAEEFKGAAADVKGAAASDAATFTKGLETFQKTRKEELDQATASGAWERAASSRKAEARAVAENIRSAAQQTTIQASARFAPTPSHPLTIPSGGTADTQAAQSLSMRPQNMPGSATAHVGQPSMNINNLSYADIIRAGTRRGGDKPGTVPVIRLSEQLKAKHMPQPSNPANDNRPPHSLTA
ncbi:hypothetical protein FJY93_00220 [Candidatus Kaiserbacteria bacterium]|nr:hypothetical protein [Candidatus Kaiserbacteria bacterium]